MTRQEATEIVARLLAAYSQTKLEPKSVALFVQEIGLLVDADVGSRAADKIIRTEERFPTIAVFREVYHDVALGTAKPSTPEPERSDEIPTWVHVWEWERRRTHLERQAMNDRYPNLKAEERPPVQMLRFPQQVVAMTDWWLTQEWRKMSGTTHPGHIETTPLKAEDPAISWEEYNALEAEWRAAGCPSVGQVSELLEKVGA